MIADVILAKWKVSSPFCALFAIGLQLEIPIFQKKRGSPCRSSRTE
nr:MAG TPA: hypothetical protein [Caudoviricetes sp.]